MKRILACLATLALAALASGAQAQGDDPIGDLIAVTTNTPTTADYPADGGFRVTLYHGGGHGIRAHDSLGCLVSPMRTLAVDPRVVSRRSIVFIKETVGMALADGSFHDGYWYASDVGGAIKGARLDLFTGQGAASMRPMATINLKSVTLAKVGEFAGCPPTDGGGGLRLSSVR
jgi:3D (Asp-Asp-Asp) domain-containing protein